MQAAQPGSGPAGQPGAAATAAGPAAPTGLEEGCDDDLFLQLAAAAEEDDDAAAVGGRSGGTASQACKSSGATGPRLSWAAKAAAAGIAGAVPPGHKPRQAVVLAPGVIPRVAPPPIAALPLPASQPAAAPSSRGVATFGAPAASRAGAGGATAKAGFADVGQGSLVERYAGLKIKNPRVSHTQLRSRLADVALLKLSQVRQRHRTAGLEGSWATICVVGEKSRPRETASGRTYSIWKVTDLDQTCVSLFLFSGAHDDLWREAEGTLVALFSPKVRAEGDFSLSVDSGSQVWVLGQSPEFGHCKATKKNGEPCRMPVNAARCPFCPYHVQTEYNKLKPTQRNEFQGSNLKTAFRPGMQRGLQWVPGEFEAVGAKPPRVKSFGASQLEGLASNARDRGSAAGARYLSTVANPAAVAAAEVAAQRRLTPAAAIAAAAKLGPAAAALAAAPIPAGRSGGALVLELPKTGGKRKAAAAALGRGAAASGSGCKRRAAGGDIGRGASLGDRNGELAEIELDDDDEGDELALAGSGGGSGGFDPTAAARQRAIELLRAAGGAKDPDPNSSNNVPEALAASVQRMAAERRSPAGAADAEQPRPGSTLPAAAGAGGRQALGQVQPAARQAQLAQQQRKQQQQQHRPPPMPSVVAGGPGAARPLPAARPAAAASGSRPGGSAAGPGSKPAAAKVGAAVPQSAMEAAFGAVVGVEAVAAAKGTRYKGLVDDEEHDKLDKVLSALETKDEMASRMDSIKSLKVQAFRCKLCNCTAERRRPECGAHPFAVERIEVTKRWWQCGGCRYRFATLGQRYPHSRCAKCNEPTEFTAVSMFRPPAERQHEKAQSGIASRANLLARGSEQKWANSW